MEKDIIYNMDCIDLMQEMGKSDITVDLVLTSPPYNIIRPNSTDRGYDIYKDGMSNEQYSNWCCEIFNHYDKVLKPNGCILWNMSYGCENTECMPLTIADIIKNTNFTMADIIVWEKYSATPNNVSQNKLTRICEFVYVFCRKNEFMTFLTNKKVINKRETQQDIYENIFNFIEAKNNDENCPLNKATFSTDFVSKLLNIYAKPKSLILDTFMGSGTTAIACDKLGHHFIGSELSKEQCDWANNRLMESRKQLSLFEIM